MFSIGTVYVSMAGLGGCGLILKEKYGCVGIIHTRKNFDVCIFCRK
jgi:hypothetical protein